MIHFFRVVKFSIQNIYRNFWLTVMTVTILVLALFSVSIVVGLNSVSKQLLTSVKDRVNISVTLKEDATDEEGRALVNRLEVLQEVKSAKFVTADEALENFRLEHQDEPDIQETLDLLEQNPLPPRIQITAKQIESFPAIISFLEDGQNNGVVETSTSEIEQAKIVIDKLSGLTNQIQNVGLAVTIIFVLISFLVVFNTIRIAIYTHREEIGIMKLVGATNWFVRMPFLVEGVLYALFATLITFAILAPVLGVLSPQLNDVFFADYNIDIAQFFEQNLWTLVLYQFIGVAILNMASASFAMSRYLKV